jgi:asparaginyl-tRNA synthetase
LDDCPEVVNDLDEIWISIEDFIQNVIRYTIDKCGDDLASQNNVIEEEKSKPQG